MARAVLIVPGSLSRGSGGNVYDRVAIEALARRGWDVDVVEPGVALDPADLVIQDSLAFRWGPPKTEAPVVALAHQLPGEAIGGTATEEERLAIGSAGAVVTVAEWLAARLQDLASGPVYVVTPGRDGAWAAEGPDADPDLVLCVGNAVPEKGLPDAVEAFARSAIPATLAIAGDMTWDEEEAHRLRDAVRSTSADVRIEGGLPPGELAKRYRRARLLLSASRYEGWPIAVAEAMGSGVPVVGFDIPGMREVVRSGIDGLLVPPGDLDALAAAVSDLWSDPERAPRMGVAARDRAMRWPTWEETGRRFARMAERLVGL